MSLTPELAEVLATCVNNSKVAAKVLFPDRFNRAFDRAHDQIFEAIDDESVQKLVIAAPRGIGKTSIASLLLPAKQILFSQKKFIVPISNSNTSAELQAENLKRELQSSLIVKKVFGDIKSDTYSKEQWVTKIAGEETCVMPRGMGQQVRGILYRNSRPDLLLFDDLETIEGVRSEVQREKVKDWFFSDALPCVDQALNNYRYIYMDTLKHEKSLLADLLDDSSWHSVRLELCDDNLISYFPNFMPTERVKSLYSDLQSQGKVDTFYREYRNQAHAGGENATFQSRFFKYYEEKEFNLNYDNEVENVLVIDPARTATLKSADSAFVNWAINTKNNSVYVRDVKGDKMDVPMFLEEMCSRILNYNVRVLGLEVTGLHEWILHPIKNELARRGISVEVVELHARGGVDEKGKVSRIKSLAYYYRQGLIYHNKNVCGPLEAQLLSFPSSKLWDIMDAFGYMPEILQKGERFMKPYDGKVEDEYSIEQEYDYINYDDMPPINFGIV